MTSRRQSLACLRFLLLQWLSPPPDASLTVNVLKFCNSSHIFIDFLLAPKTLQNALDYMSEPGLCFAKPLVKFLKVSKILVASKSGPLTKLPYIVVVSKLVSMWRELECKSASTTHRGASYSSRCPSQPCSYAHRQTTLCAFLPDPRHVEPRPSLSILCMHRQTSTHQQTPSCMRTSRQARWSLQR
jgi:hypothetical protein